MSKFSASRYPIDGHPVLPLFVCFRKRMMRTSKLSTIVLPSLKIFWKFDRSFRDPLLLTPSLSNTWYNSFISHPPAMKHFVVGRTQLLDWIPMPAESLIQYSIIISVSTLVSGKFWSKQAVRERNAVDPHAERRWYRYSLYVWLLDQSL